MEMRKELKRYLSWLTYLSVVAFVGLSVSGCYHVKLYGRVEKLNASTYASHALLTPDPQLRKPLVGQRLVVSWVLSPSVHPERDPCFLDCVIYTTKGKRIKERVLIDRHYYHWEYSLSNERMLQEGAIATYRLAISQGGREIRSFEHKLYKPMMEEEIMEEEPLEDLL